MKSMDKQWYKQIWSLDIKNQSWVENTSNEVDFIIENLHLSGKERILDLACGFGRHSLELARRGYTVVGVDITKEFVEDANAQARKENLSASFIQMDIREIDYHEEFDVVLNLADGAIGYLENERENQKIFDCIAKALKPGGKHFMDIMSADYADAHFPCRLWDKGKQGVTLSQFQWDREARLMLYGQTDFSFGQVLEDFEQEGCPTRLYSIQEISQLFQDRGLTVLATYSDYQGAIADKDHIQLMVVSQKK